MAKNAPGLDIPPKPGIHKDFHLHLDKDTLLDNNTHSTRNKAYTSSIVAKQGQTPGQAKWLTYDALQRMLAHLLMKAGTLLDINMEELGQGDPPRGALHSTNVPKWPPIGTDTWGTQFN